MRQWDLELALESRDAAPAFLRIARAMVDAIRRGRLVPGGRLPGSRSLATSLGVSRNTIVAAYLELASEGWIEGSRGRGTFVSKALPVERPRAFGARRSRVPARLGFEMGPEPEIELDPPLPPGTLRFGSGTPDLQLVPVEALSRAYRRAVRSAGRSVLGYGSFKPRGEDAAFGHPRLRDALASMLAATRGLAAARDSVLVTRGSQMALAVVAKALIAPGDLVAVEELGNRPAWAAFRAAGARIVPVPVDGNGLDVDKLEALVSKEPVKAVYLTPLHQHPTTVTLSPGRRLRLLELARARRFAIVEDDYDHEFHYESRPVLPMASVDTAGVVVYIGTLSKILAPGPRIGYVVAPPRLVERAAVHRSVIDVQGDLAVESAVADLLEEGEMARHVRRARRIYQARRDVLVASLTEGLEGRVSFRVPTGGMALWMRVLPPLDVEAWARRTLARGAAFLTARTFTFDGRPRPFARLGFTSLSERDLNEALRRLVAAADG